MRDKAQEGHTKSDLSSSHLVPHPEGSDKRGVFVAPGSLTD